MFLNTKSTVLEFDYRNVRTIKPYIFYSILYKALVYLTIFYSLIVPSDSNSLYFLCSYSTLFCCAWLSFTLLFHVPVYSTLLYSTLFYPSSLDVAAVLGLFSASWLLISPHDPLFLSGSSCV